jgi:hypothetical protein
MPDYLQSVRKKMEKQGISEEEIKTTLSELALQARKNSAKTLPLGISSVEEALKKENIRLSSENHEWKVKYRELETEFNVLKESKNEIAFASTLANTEELSNEQSSNEIPDFLKE